MVLAGLALSAPASGLTGNAAQADEIPPSGTYEATLRDGSTTSLTLSCDASSCEVSGLDLDIGALAKVGPEHYQGAGPFPDDFGAPPVCGNRGGAQQRQDLAIVGEQATLTVTLEPYSVTCGVATDTFEGAVFGVSFDLPVASTTTSQVTTTTSQVTTSTVTTTVAPGAQEAVGAGEMTDRQRRSLAAVERGERSTVPASLVVPSEAMSSDLLAANAFLAGLLVLLLVFPSELFNATYEEHHGRVTRAFARLPWRPGRRPAVGNSASIARNDSSSSDQDQGLEVTGDRSGGARRYAVVLVSGAIIAGFLDPGFGLNEASISFVVGVVVACLFGLLIFGFTARMYRRARGLPTGAALDAVPAGLLIAVATVVLSRLVHFRPGYLYGLIGGLAFLAVLDRRDAGRFVFVDTVVTLVVAVTAWFAFIPVSAAANRAGASLGIEVADAVLASLFIVGVEKTLFSMPPLNLLPGRTLSRWSWPAWLAIAFAASFLFVNVLLRPENGYLGQSTTASAVLIYSLFAGFGAFSVGFWAWFKLRPDDPHLPPP